MRGSGLDGTPEDRGLEGARTADGTWADGVWRRTDGEWRQSRNESVAFSGAEEVDEADWNERAWTASDQGGDVGKMDGEAHAWPVITRTKGEQAVRIEWLDGPNTAAARCWGRTSVGLPAR